MKTSEYAKSGVDYSLMEPFKMAMIEAGKKTLAFPNKRGVYVVKEAIHAHGAVYEYKGPEKHPIYCKTQEDLGTKNWIAEWMYMKTGRSFYENIAIDVALIVVNDVIAQGAMPVIFTDQVESGDASWYGDKKRAQDFADGFVKICKEVGMALPAGESATLKYIIKPEAPSLSGSVTGIIAPRSRLITGKKLKAGDHIIGVTSSGLHANGVSLVIKKGLELKDQFLTKINNSTFGELALTPTRSYVKLIEKLLEEDVDIHTLLPGTGDGVGKIAFDKRPFTYRINTWPDVPEFFRYFHEELGVSLADCLKTFNWGIGYYIFVPAKEVNRVMDIGKATGYTLHDLGVVESGKRQTIFTPGGITLPPPGEY
ncbi:MAG: AIR synthase related protein [Patescibacteria group bacterium]